jgi:hypothetical protein
MSIPFPRGAALLAALVMATSNFGWSQAMKVRPLTMKVKPDIVCVSCALTLSVSPAVVNFALVQNGTAVGSSPVTIATIMSGTANVIGTLNVYGYFANSAAALTGSANSADVIPSSAVLGKDPAGVPTSYTAFTQTSPVGAAGGSLEIFSYSILAGVLLPIARTDSLSLEINLAGLPQLPADSYSGVLVIQAQQF